MDAQPQPLTDEQLKAILPELNVAWSVIPGQGLVRVFDTGTFAKGVALIAKLAPLAEQCNHHPDVHLAHDDVEVTLFTHSVGAITKLDVAFAKAIDAEL